MMNFNPCHPYCTLIPLLLLKPSSQQVPFYLCVFNVFDPLSLSLHALAFIGCYFLEHEQLNSGYTTKESDRLSPKHHDSK